jgi:membrane protein DedA with SNARE-associated domain
VYASLGNGLGKVVDKPDLGVVFRPSVLLPIIALAVLALIPVWYKRRRRKQTI